MKSHVRAVAAAGLLAAGLTTLFSLGSSAGPLTPPAGPVAPTGSTVGEIKTAVDALVPAPGGLPALGDSQVFLFVTGIPGESTNITHKDWIDGLAAEWSAVVSGLSAPSATDVRVRSARFDKAAPLLAQALFNGAILTSVVVDFVRPAQSSPWLKVELTNAKVSEFSPILSGPTPGYTVSFNPSTIRITYTQFDTNGKPLGTTIFTWNFKTGAP